MSGLDQLRKLHAVETRLDNISDQLVIHISISMEQEISERDYLLVVRDLASQLLINFCKLAKRFAKYLELPLNSGLQQCTLEVIAKRLSGYELRDEI